MGDRPVAETSTQRNRTLTADRQPCPGRDSKLQPQQASDRTPKP